MRTLAKSEDADEMSHNSGSALFAKREMSFRERNKVFWGEIITCASLIYSMDHPEFIVSNQREEFISA